MMVAAIVGLLPRHRLAGDPDAAGLAPAGADEWPGAARVASCAGNTEANGTDPRADAALLHAFEPDEAVNEVMYEARNRPSRLPIALDSLAAWPATAPGRGAGDSP